MFLEVDVEVFTLDEVYGFAPVIRDRRAIAVYLECFSCHLPNRRFVVNDEHELGRAVR